MEAPKQTGLQPFFYLFFLRVAPSIITITIIRTPHCHALVLAPLKRFRSTFTTNLSIL
jgi:hypothetical protein